MQWAGTALQPVRTSSSNSPPGWMMVELRPAESKVPMWTECRIPAAMTLEPLRIAYRARQHMPEAIRYSSALRFQTSILPAAVGVHIRGRHITKCCIGLTRGPDQMCRELGRQNAHRCQVH